MQKKCQEIFLKNAYKKLCLQQFVYYTFFSVNIKIFQIFKLEGHKKNNPVNYIFFK